MAIFALVIPISYRRWRRSNEQSFGGSSESQRSSPTGSPHVNVRGAAFGRVRPALLPALPVDYPPPVQTRMPFRRRRSRTALSEWHVIHSLPRRLEGRTGAALLRNTRKLRRQARLNGWFLRRIGAARRLLRFWRSLRNSWVQRANYSNRGRCSGATRRRMERAFRGCLSMSPLRSRVLIISWIEGGETLK